jgi:hypothetical protein
VATGYVSSVFQKILGHSSVFSGLHCINRGIWSYRAYQLSALYEREAQFFGNSSLKASHLAETLESHSVDLSENNLFYLALDYALARDSEVYPYGIPLSALAIWINWIFSSQLIVFSSIMLGLVVSFSILRLLGFSPCKSMLMLLGILGFLVFIQEISYHFSNQVLIHQVSKLQRITSFRDFCSPGSKNSVWSWLRVNCKDLEHQLHEGYSVSKFLFDFLILRSVSFVASVLNSFVASLSFKSSLWILVSLPVLVLALCMRRCLLRKT